MNCDIDLMSIYKIDSLIGIGQMSVCCTNEVFNGKKPLKTKAPESLL